MSEPLGYGLFLFPYTAANRSMWTTTNPTNRSLDVTARVITCSLMYARVAVCRLHLRHRRWIEADPVSLDSQKLPVDLRARRAFPLPSVMRPNGHATWISMTCNVVFSWTTYKRQARRVIAGYAVIDKNITKHVWKSPYYVENIIQKLCCNAVFIRFNSLFSLPLAPLSPSII